MGEPVTVVETKSSRAGYVRFETNRSFTGMGHERYTRGDEVFGERPPDVIAQRLLETGQVDEVHVYAQTVTVKVARGSESTGLKEIIEELHTYYRPGVEIPDPDSFT